MKTRTLILAALIICCAARAEMRADYEKALVLLKQIENANNEKALGALLMLFEENVTRAQAAKHISGRRMSELKLSEIQATLGRMSDPACFQKLAEIFPRLRPEVQTALCFGLTQAPAHVTLDDAILAALRKKPVPPSALKVAAIDVLAAHQLKDALPDIQALLNVSETGAVQIAACRALARMRDASSVAVLMRYLQALKTHAPIGRYVYEAVGTLRTLTGEKLPVEILEWERWWTDKGKLAAAETITSTATAEYNYETSEAKGLTYYDIPIVESRIIFVIDMSGSMNLGGKPDRLQQAQKELQTVIEGLTPHHYFNIIAFAGGTLRWDKKSALVQATPDMRASAVKFVKNLNANGGTNTAGAMEEALRQIAAGSACEAIYLVSDGAPNEWAAGITSLDQERQITWVNQPLKVRINTVGIYTMSARDPKPLRKQDAEDLDAMKSFLYALAASNDGVYREIGRETVVADKDKAKK